MHIRLKGVAFLFLLVGLVIACRLFFLQVFNYEKYVARAEDQQGVENVVEPRRGAIYLVSRGGSEEGYIPVALTRRFFHIWASPKDLTQEDRERILQYLPEVAGADRETLASRISKEGDPYEPLIEKVDEETKEKISVLGIDGLHADPIQDRYYPLGTLGASFVGFLGKEDDQKTGRYGLEEYFNAELSGEAGRVEGFRNPVGRLIAAFSRVAKPKDGADLYLTVDYSIQRVLEEKLAAMREHYSAERAIGIILDPRTGAVRAMATVPAFDPNRYGEIEDPSRFMNHAVQGVYEPGSVFKPVTMAAALDSHVVSPELTYVDEGSVIVGPATIKNATGKGYGIQTMTQVLEKSLNTGVVFAVRRMPRGVWRDYVEKFGFNEKTGIELTGEVRGDTKNFTAGEVEVATSAFGQGVAVTPLSLVSAIGTMANGGVLMKPYIVDRIVSSSGEVLFQASPEERRRVVSEETARTITQMLVSVVENGSGRRTKLPGHWVAAKTGTAQVPDGTGGYSDKTIQSFVGYAPAYEPAFAMLIRLDGPRGAPFAESSVGPVFGEVADFVLQYYGIEPEKPLN